MQSNKKASVLHIVSMIKQISFFFKLIFSGVFWVDPNEGVPEDAMSVYCDFSFNATCLFSNEERKVRFKAALCISMKFLVPMRAAIPMLQIRMRTRTIWMRN